MAFLINEDHWAFLEDIEAPMWVDLTLEANSNNHDNYDDKWFYTSHQFHQFSSSHLKSIFSHSGDGSSNLDFNLVGPSSPKLPASVSKSRGKQYKSKKWKGVIQNFSIDKRHPVKVLTEKPSQVKQGPRDKMKHKLSFIESKKASVSKPSVVCESSSGGKAISNCSNKYSTCGSVSGSLSSDANKKTDTNPTSTVTSEAESCCRKQFKPTDVSSQAFGHTSGLLSTMNIGLRKSFIARRATRMEFNNNGKQSMGRNSTSSKSSVGSSSNPRRYVRVSTSMSIQSKEITPGSRNVGRMIYVAKSKMNSPGVVKAPPINIEEGTSNNRREGLANTTKSTRQEAAKRKVVCRPSRNKALVPSRVNEQDSTIAATKTKKKAGFGVTKSNISVDNGKENVMGKMSMSQKKCSGRDIAGGDIAGRVQKGSKQSHSGRNGTAGTACPKGKGRGQGNLDKPRNSMQRVHFR